MSIFLTKENFKINQKKFLILTIAIIFLPLNHFGYLELFIRFIGLGWLETINLQFIVDSRNQSKELFLTLSFLKSGLCLLQSSEAGLSLIVDFQVQLGEVLSSLSQLISHSWHISMVGLASLYIFELIILVGQFCFKPFISLWLLGVIWSQLPFKFSTNWQNISRRFLGIITGLILFFYVVFPISLIICKNLSDEITSSRIYRIHKSLKLHHDDLKKDLRSEKIHEQVKSSLDVYKKWHQEKRESLKKIYEHLLHLIILILFDAVIFPFSIILLIYYFFHSLLQAKINYLHSN